MFCKDLHLSILPTNAPRRSRSAVDASGPEDKVLEANQQVRPEAETAEQETATSTSTWSIDQARELYGVRGWGEKYFDINNDGNVAFTAPTESGLRTVSMMDVIDGLHQRDLRMPVMLRIENLIEDRVRQLNSSFNSAIYNARYQGDFRAVSRSRSISSITLLIPLVAQGVLMATAWKRAARPSYWWRWLACRRLRA